MEIKGEVDKPKREIFHGSDLERLRHYSTQGASGECWPWNKYKLDTGHGQMWSSFHQRVVLAYRRAYEIENRVTLDPSIMLDHRCRNPECVNPRHLQVTTMKKNQENLKGARVNSKTGVRGVTPWKNGRFRASVNHNQKHHHVGLFDSVEEAERAVIAKRNELFTNNLKDRSVA